MAALSAVANSSGSLGETTVDDAIVDGEEGTRNDAGPNEAGAADRDEAAGAAPAAAAADETEAEARLAGANATRRGADTSGGFESVRSAYEELGSTGFYEAHGGEYTNPHEPALTQALAEALEQWGAELPDQLRLPNPF